MAQASGFRYDSTSGQSMTTNLSESPALRNRIVLTRDTGIPKRKGPQRTILIHSNYTFEQLKEVLSCVNPPLSYPALNLNPPLHPSQEGTIGRNPRCTLCNGELALTAKNAVAGRVPEHVFLNAAYFLTCMECGKVYWHGSHKRSIDSRLQEILEQIADRP